ncbi:MAG: hypothetical protein HN576_00080 [Bacteriovoracaceae bacterium]|jgi:hypothetical protein|nr:hypothetical protein [Bacteriovoracaceae bacterium]
MAKIIILFGSLLAFIAFADESNKGQPTFNNEKMNFKKKSGPEFLISGTYRNGEYLIYDCKKRHFACVNNDSYANCEKRRKESFELKYSFLPCVPLKKFKEQRLCFKKQVELIGQVPDKKFCINVKRSLLD